MASLPLPTAALITVGAFDTPGEATRVAPVGDRAYLVDSRSSLAPGLRILDISDPGAPVELGFLETPAADLTDVVVSGALVYVTYDARGISGYASGVHILDVSDPAAPFEIGSLDTFDEAVGIAVAGGRAYVANGHAGVRLIDVSDPTAPSELGAVDTLGIASDVAVADGLIYVADQESGLRIIDLGPEYAQTLAVAADIKPCSDRIAIPPVARGVLPVALLGSDDFDAEDVDRTTLAFGPGAATPAHAAGGHLEDVNADGYTDLVSHYAVEDARIGSGDTQACVSGRTLGGATFEGCDTLEVIGRMGAQP